MSIRLRDHLERQGLCRADSRLAGRGLHRQAVLLRLASPELAIARVRQRARQVGTGVVVWKDGHVVEEQQNTSAGE